MTINIPLQELVVISKLSVDGENPNRMTDKQLERLKTSIEKYGFIVPIITNNKYLVADGEQRLTVAKSLGYSHVPVVKLDVEDVDRRLLRQVLNKLRGEHDLIADALEFEKIIGMGNEDELKHLLDLSDSQLERYLAEIREPKDEDYDIPEIDKIRTEIQRGDIIKLGSHRLMCGDATIVADVETLLKGEKANMVLTDPPYGLDIVKHHQIGGGNWVKPTAYNPVIGDHKGECDPIHLISYSDKVMIFGANHFANKLPNMPCWIVWMKKHPDSESNFFGDCELIWTNINKPPRIYKCVWRGCYEEGESGSRIHPTQKPVKLIADILTDYSNNPDIILDPYGGSGSTLIACEQTGRRCYMMEIDPRYCQVIVDRWESYTNQKAEMVKTGEINVCKNGN